MQYYGHVENGVVVFEGEGVPVDGTRVRVESVDVDPAPTSLFEKLEKLAGRAVGLPADMAENHDHYLHGQPKR